MAPVRLSRTKKLTSGSRSVYFSAEQILLDDVVRSLAHPQFNKA